MDDPTKPRQVLPHTPGPDPMPELLRSASVILAWYRQTTTHRGGVDHGARLAELIERLTPSHRKASPETPHEGGRNG